MSIINGTIIVQAFNFSIAFILIKYFFFKPILEQIQIEDAMQESLIATVQEHQLAVGQKEQEIIDQWKEMRFYFAQHTPSLKPEIFFAGKRPPIIVPVFAQETIEDVANSITPELIKKVDHVGE